MSILPIPFGESRTIDDGSAGYSTRGRWNRWGRFDRDLQFSAKGNGSNRASWQFDNLSGGTYRVLATWTAHANRASDAPFRVLANGRTALTQQVNQRQAPRGTTAGGRSWHSLGNVTVDSHGQLIVELSNDANGYVIADSIRVEKVAGNEGDQWFCNVGSLLDEV